MYSKYTKVYKAIPLFFRLESNEFPDIGSVGRIKKKKNSPEVSEKEVLVPQDDVKS